MLPKTLFCNVVRFCPFKALIFILAIGSCLIGSEAQSHECSSHPSSEEFAQKRGRKLATQFWNNVEKQDVKAYSKQLACNFQGLSIDGIYNRDDQINGLMNLTVTDFRLENLVAARHCETLVTSYDFFAQGQGIVSGPSIDVWQRTRDGWKMISHSYVPFQ